MLRVIEDKWHELQIASIREREFRYNVSYTSPCMHVENREPL